MGSQIISTSNSLAFRLTGWRSRRAKSGQPTVERSSQLARNCAVGLPKPPPGTFQGPRLRVSAGDARLVNCLASIHDASGADSAEAILGDVAMVGDNICTLGAKALA